MNRKFHFALVLLAGLSSTDAIRAASPAATVLVSPTGRPRSFDVHFVPYKVAGYGNASFGMAPDQVRALVAHDYPAALASLKEGSDITSGLRTLTIVVPALAPGPGPATITYVFGSGSQRLAAVNVYWIATGQATQEQRAALVTAGASVVGGLAGWKWDGAWLGRVIGPNELVVFSGLDVSGGGVEVRLDGVDLDVQTAATAVPLTPLVHRPAALGPARLRLSFVSDNQHPDVYRIPAGAF